MWFLILQREIFGNWTKNGGNQFSIRFTIFPMKKKKYSLECNATTLLIISVPEVGIDDITLVHLHKEGNTVSYSAL